MSIYFWSYLINTVGTMFVIFYIFMRASNYKCSDKQKVISMFWCIAWAFIFSINILPLLLIRVLYCVASIAFIRKTTKIKTFAVISAFLLAYVIGNVLFAIAFFPVAFILAPFMSSVAYYYYVADFNDPVFLLLYTVVAALQFVAAVLFFKIRRFRLGLPFLSEKYAMPVVLIISGVIFTIVSAITAQRGEYGTFAMVLLTVFGAAVIGFGIYAWIRMSIKLFQRKKIRERNEELLLQEIDELTRQLQHYKDMHELVRDANHKMMHRQTVAERSILKLWEKAQKYGLTAEFSDELEVELHKIKTLSREYQDSVGLESKKMLPSTNIKEIDDMFAFFAERFAAESIDFNLKVNGSVIYMAEKIIEQSKLETMIGDHLQDALIAVKSCTDKTHSVLAMIGEAGNYYEFSVYDSGIPFEIDVLTKLGLEYVTTHEEDGGSGVGFMTTFETMRKCEASLIIKENKPDFGFSKSITIRFDGKNEYIIETYRPGDFPVNERYIVIGL